MHNNFIEKNRRYINLRNAEVKGVLPEYFQQSFPQFIALLEKYYDWQESEELKTGLSNPAELLHHIFSSRDITETDITLLSFIEDELLLGDAYFEGFGRTESELRAAANFSNVLFRSKGTKFAIEWFFRSFYGVDAEVEYPKKDIFKIGDSFSQIGPSSNKFITNDTLYQTWSILLKSSIPISRWKEIFKLFAHPAGMYLAGNVIIDGDYSSSLTPMGLDSAVTTRLTPTYSLEVNNIPLSSVGDEGSVFNYTLTGNNLPDDGGIAYYYVNNVTTVDSDFLTVPPKISAPEIFPIDAGTGTFTVSTKRDSDETEGTESFEVVVLDDELRTIASDTQTIDNVISSYVIVPGSFSIFEGDTIEYIVFGIAGTTPNDTHQLKYYFNETGFTAVDSDFTEFPTIGSPNTITVVDDSARFTLQSRINAVSPESVRTFQIVVATPTGVVKTNSGTQNLNNTVPTFTLSPSGPISTVEGDSDLYVDLVVDPTTVGLNADWSVDSDLDGRLPITSGSFQITSENMSNIFLTGINPSDTYQGTDKQFANITVTTNSIYNPEFTTSTFKQITNQEATYGISGSPEFASEGDTIDLVVNTTNAEPGTYYYFIEHLTTDNTDFSVAPPLSGTRQSFTISGNTTTISNAFTFTNTSDPDQEFKVYVTDQGPSGGGVLSSTTYTIRDAAKTFSLASSTETPSEGDTVTMTFNTNDTDGEWYYYIDGPNISSDDFSSGWPSFPNTRVPFTVTGGVGTFDLTIAEDGTAEDAELVNVYVSKTILGGVVVSDTFTIQASVGPSLYDVSVTASGESTNVAREGKDFFVNVTGSTANTLYVEVTGIPTSRLAVSETQKIINFFGGTQNGGAHVTLTNNDYLGTSNGTVNVSINNYASAGGTIVGTVSFSFLDASPLYTLSSSVSSENEGNTVTYTFDGTNVPSGTYVHHNEAIKGKALTVVYSPNDTRIFLNNTTGIVNGMKCLNNIDTGFNSTVTNVGSTFVDISPSVPSDAPVVSTGLKIYWGYDADKNDTTEFVTEFTSTGTPDTEVFTVDFLEDNDVGVEDITWGVYDDDGNQLVTRTVSISGDDLEVIISDVDNAEYITSDVTPIVASTIEFRPDGRIFASDPNLQTVTDTGETWISDRFDPSFDASNYSIIATLISEVGVGDTVGEFGTVRDLSSTRTWQSVVEDPNFTHSVTITFQIYETSNIPNSDTWENVLIRAREFYTDEGGILP